LSSTDTPDPATKVILVRHGRTAVNAQGRLSGRHDPELDELGERQVRAAAGAVQRLVDGRTVTVVTSPLVRCFQTAEAVRLACRGVEPRPMVDDRFIELDYGDWDGRKLSDVPPESWTRWREDPGFAPPGGETLTSVTARVSEGVRDWVSRRPGEVLVVASHVSPIKAAVIWALGVGEQATWRLRLSNASVTSLDVIVRPSGEVSATVTAFNETSHLEQL
jgi:probable phosphoglycerate mutase